MLKWYKAYLNIRINAIEKKYMEAINLLEKRLNKDNQQEEKLAVQK